MLLGVGASLQFFRGPRALARRVAATLRALDLRVSLGMAPTAAGAWLLAQRRERRACRRVLTLPTLVRRLDALPLALLPRRGRAWTGCRTSAAPRWATCAPCRAPACSGAARPNCWRRWTPPMAWRPSRNAGSSRRALRPPHRADGIPEHTDAVLAVARRLAEQLAGWLASGASWRCARSRSAWSTSAPPRAPAHRAGTGAVATSLPAQILGLLREKLAA